MKNTSISLPSYTFQGADPESDSQAAGPSGRTTPRPGTTNAPTTSSAAPSNETPGQPLDRQTSTTTLTRVTPRSPDNRSIASAPLLDPGPARDVASVAGSSVYSTELAAYSGLPRNSDPSGFPSRQTGASRYISTVQNTRTSSFSHRSISQLEYVQRRQEDLSRGRIQLDEGVSYYCFYTT